MHAAGRLDVYLERSRRPCTWFLPPQQLHGQIGQEEPLHQSPAHSTTPAHLMGLLLCLPFRVLSESMGLTQTCQQQPISGE